MRTMAFIDYQNFNIGLKKYFDSIGEKPFNVIYSKLACKINEKISLETQLMKTYLFAHKPCDELLKLPNYKNYYDWLCSIKNKPYFEVVEGIQDIRPKEKELTIDVTNPKTYITKEKETDISLATNMISKAYQNAYDIAILISGDTDYVPVVKELNRMGKIVVIASFPKQNISKYDEFKDEHILLDIEILKNSR